MKKIILLSFITIVYCAKVLAQDKTVVFEKIWNAVGGEKTFEQSRYFQFTFASEKDGKISSGRTHIWDRYTGDYRLETSVNDKKTVVLFNINTKAGKAFENGNALPDSVSEKLVKKAYGSFINDTYWLMVPLKLQDPGVNTTLEANEMVGDVNCNVIHLNFDKVGLTPGDQYWLYVNDKSGEIIQWKFLLQNRDVASVFEWAPYQDLGNGLKLSLKKINKANGSAIVFPNTKVLRSVDKDIFIKP